jgi:hypothetical protein
MWSPNQHTDQENLHWCWLRAIEWGRWPVFISQIVAPPMLYIFNWLTVVSFFVVLNILWSLFIKYKYVNVKLAFVGVLATKLKWLICPLLGYYFYTQNEVLVAVIALFWPLLIFIIGALPTTQITVIQDMFMIKLGYIKNDLSTINN